MKLIRYDYQTKGNAELFRFTSIGPNGRIKKLIVYSQMLQEYIYNLAFDDYQEETDTINDAIATNNNDSKKVLATVASTLYLFTEKHPDCWVYATGSNDAITRLYRMGITANLEEIMEDFEIWSLRNSVWYEFEKRNEYEAFLVNKKNYCSSSISALHSSKKHLHTG
jgi:hypothetical protein